MRTILLFALVALFAGVGVVALIETDPGYVLISYGVYTLETSLWVGLLLLATFTFLVYVGLRLLRKVFSRNNSLVSWLGGRRGRVSQRLTTRGLIGFIEGNWSKSRRQLLRGVRNNEAPLLNYLTAARASYELGELDKMREYLGAAEASESEAGIAVELTQAELKLSGEQYEQALATLVRARANAGRHPHVLDLLCQAYYGLRDWQNLAVLIPDLRKYKVRSEEQLQVLEREIYGNLLRYSGDAEALQQQWQATPAALKRDGEFISAYIGVLIEQEAFDPAAKLLQRALKQNWDAGLVRLYGLLAGGNSAKYLAQAEAWLGDHKDDAGLLLSLGRLCCRESLWGKARDYFESSYKLERTAEVCAELGRLLGGLGEVRPSGAYFREGLLLAQTSLPELPSPNAQVPGTHRLTGSA
jgi:HemY protein